MISEESIRNAVVKLFLTAETRLPGDVAGSLSFSRERESGIARTQLENIIENIQQSEQKKIPMCQDTGLPLVFVKIGGKAKVDLSRLYEAISCGIIEATIKIPLRGHIVEPVSRKSITDSMEDYSQLIHLDVNPEADYIELTVFPKGGGSENMSSLGMLKPSEGMMGVKKFVIETVAKAGGNPCPPIVVGVGIGGNSDVAMKLAKKALLRKLDDRSKDEKIAELEMELLEEINKLGVGPMGLGGKTTALAVKIMSAPCHTASLPVGVNIQCWADRRASARIYEDRVELEDE